MNTLLVITLAVAIPVYALLWHNQRACAQTEKTTATQAVFNFLFNLTWLTRIMAPVARWLVSNIKFHRKHTFSATDGQ